MHSPRESKDNSAADSPVSIVIHKGSLPSCQSPVSQPDRDGTGLVFPNLRLRGRESNLIGPMLGRLRYERGLTQDMLAARLQIQGCDITRDIIYNIEARRSVVTDKQLVHLVRIFKLRLCDLFPDEIRKTEENLWRNRFAG